MSELSLEENTAKRNEDIESWSIEKLRSELNSLDEKCQETVNEIRKTNREKTSIEVKYKDNNEKIKINKTLPYLVATVHEILYISPDPLNEDEDNTYKNEKIPCVIIKTSTRQVVFLPNPGLLSVPPLTTNSYIAVNKDNYLILEMLPSEHDSRVTAMEVDEKPQESYSDIGGLDKQIEELIEAIVLPIIHKEKFEKIGIVPPKGVLMYGAPGTGKTLLARACAAQLAAPQLVQMFIGDGAKLVRDAFDLAREKAPSIIFIDELDAIGAKRQDAELSGDREVQRTMLELLNQLDGFSSNHDVKVIVATNRPDTLDPALLRSGRIDRKIELPAPNEESRARILQIHSRKMNVNKDDVDFQELARATEDFNGAQLKAVCTEAGLIGVGRKSFELVHQDFVEGIAIVRANKKYTQSYHT